MLFIQNILGKPLGRGHIRYHSPTVMLHLDPHHYEEISFWVLEGSTSDVVLGRPWLQLHRPLVDWMTRKVLEWGPNCEETCYQPKHSDSFCPTSQTLSACSLYLN